MLTVFTELRVESALNLIRSYNVYWCRDSTYLSCYNSEKKKNQTRQLLHIKCSTAFYSLQTLEVVYAVISDKSVWHWSLFSTSFLFERWNTCHLYIAACIWGVVRFWWVFTTKSLNDQSSFYSSSLCLELYDQTLYLNLFEL